eukprot:c8876_g2_i1.p1 GENE.c8876_g2_i1~~c8876_g2_i1.p1  ORF type:complete len:548 (-),score=66.37 c8876_g2_i1:54-1697(-)
MGREFQYRVEHVAGVVNVWADLLSRWGCGVLGRDEGVSRMRALRAVRVVREPVVVEVKLDLWPALEYIIDAQQRVQVDETTGGLGLRWDEARGYCDGSGRCYVPDVDDLRVRVCIVAHAGLAGHRGVGATLAAVLRVFVWERVKDDVSRVVLGCVHCVKLDGRKTIPRPLGTQIQATKPNELLHFDFLKMGESLDGMSYILVLKDDFSTFVELVPAACATAAVVVQALLGWFSRYGVVSLWVSDQGTHFKNTIVGELARLLKVDHHFTVVYSPWANGVVERENREVVRVFRALLAENRMQPSDWSCLVPIVQSVLNSSPSPRLGGVSPREIMMGLPPMAPLEIAYVRPDVEEVASLLVEVGPLVAKHLETLRAALSTLHAGVKKARDRRTGRASKTVGEQVDFGVGDYVLVASVHPEKLRAFWRGPFQVAEQLNKWVYGVRSVVSGEVKNVHACRLRKFADSQLNLSAELKLAAEYDEEAVVEKVVDHRKAHEGLGYELRVRWLGFEDSEDTWEPLDTLFEDVPTVVRNYVDGAGDGALAETLEMMR